MKRFVVPLVFMVALLLFPANQVNAADFRCGARIIAIGSHKNDVLRKCGEPSYVEVRQEIRTKRDLGPGILDPERGFNRFPLWVEELVIIEEWEYNRGSGSFIRYLRFENGRLTRIIEGDYGY